MATETELLEGIVNRMPAYAALIRSTQNADGSFPWGDKRVRRRRSLDQTLYALDLAEERGMRLAARRAVGYVEKRHEKGTAFNNEFLDDAPDVKTASLVASQVARVKPEARVIDDAFRFVEQRVDDGRPLVQREYRMQNAFMAALQTMHALAVNEREGTRLFDDVEDFVLSFQEKDGGFFYPIRGLRRDLLYARYCRAPDYRAELTSYFVRTCAHTDLDDEPVGRAADFLQRDHRYKFGLSHVLTSVAAALLGVTDLSHEELRPELRRETEAIVFSKPTKHIEHRMHTARHLRELRDTLVKRAA